MGLPVAAGAACRALIGQRYLGLFVILWFMVFIARLGGLGFAFNTVAANIFFMHSESALVFYWCASLKQAKEKDVKRILGFSRNLYEQKSCL